MSTKIMQFKKISTKKIPVWYRIYLEKRLRRLEDALKWLNIAEKANDEGFPYIAKVNFNIAKRILNQ